METPEGSVCSVDKDPISVQSEEQILPSNTQIQKLAFFLLPDGAVKENNKVLLRLRVKG